MDAPFDTKREDQEIASERAREEEDVEKILSGKYGLVYADLTGITIDTDALRLIPQEKAKTAEAIAFAKTAKVLSIAVHNPNNPALADVLKELGSEGYTLKQFLVSKASYEKALDRYADLSYATQAKPGVFVIENMAELRPKVAALSDLRHYLEDAATGRSLERVTRILEGILAGAFAEKASDIHFEPEEEKTRLRLRIDGLLTDIYYFEPEVYHLLNSRIKLLSGVKLNVADRAQDGRFEIVRDSVEIEVRASFIPGNYGESIVLRLLDPASIQVSFKDLGIDAKLLKRLEVEIHRANGMLLTTGPTGSGKTTSLYSFLREIQSPDIKLITIEEPIEYHLPGIVQTQADEKKYTFADGLRSIVRQDPDVIMVGEIRDSQTANIAIEAALTGHFVFSTLHTNNAAGTFPRLVDLDADPKLFASAITVSMAQRLVRRLNQETKKARPMTDAEKKQVDAVLDSIVDQSLIPEKRDTLYDPTPGGEDTGYKGRIGIYEAIFMDDELGAFLRDNPPENEIAKHAARQGYLTMAQDGVLKALAGITSLAEVATTVDLPQV